MPIILLFTRLDLFEEKINRHPLKDQFPEFTGRKNDSSAAMEFITEKFHSISQKYDIEIEVRVINATDTAQTRDFLQSFETKVTEGKGHGVYEHGTPSNDADTHNVIAPHDSARTRLYWQHSFRHSMRSG